MKKFKNLAILLAMSIMITAFPLVTFAKDEEIVVDDYAIVNDFAIYDDIVTSDDVVGSDELSSEEVDVSEYEIYDEVGDLYAATVTWPAKKNIKTYAKSTKNDTKVYKTSTSTDGSYGTIYATDLITINGYDNGRYYVNYPISGGTKNGWVKASDITSATFNVAKSKYTAAAKTTTYRRSSGGAELGYISKGDTVYKIAASGDYTQVIYPVSGGYKMGWIYVSNNKSSDISKSLTLTNALYNINVSTSKITCGYDGYVNTKGKHEGIDFKYYEGANVYSLTDGVITGLTTGKTGSSGLLTIAVYNKSADRTVVYLHTAPKSSLKVGQSIKKGDKIATESWRGVSSSKSAHTHVEVRVGKKTMAAKSVNDYTLDNPNPNSFWNSQGYIVK